MVGFLIMVYLFFKSLNLLFFAPLKCAQREAGSKIDPALCKTWQFEISSNEPVCLRRFHLVPPCWAVQCVAAHYQVKILKLGVCLSSSGLSMCFIIEEVQELPIWFIRLEELDLIWCEELESSVLNFFNDKIHGKSLGLKQTPNFKVFTW